jgi:two-component system response regulator HydG
MTSFFSILETPGESIINEDNIQLSTLEKNAILRVIEKHSGNITRAAKELGLTRTALYRRLSKYDI